MDHGLLLHCCCVSGFAGRSVLPVRTVGGHGIQRHRPQRYYRIFSDSDKHPHSHVGVLGVLGASIGILVSVPATDLTCLGGGIPLYWVEFWFMLLAS